MKKKILWKNMNIKKHKRKIIWSAVATVAIASSAATIKLNQQSAQFDQISQQTHQTQNPTTSAQCDQGLWQHVYNPQRLIVHQQCVTVTGILVDATNGKQKDGVRHEADGDTHGWIKLDPQFSSMLNQGNMTNEGGNLVFEIICHFKITQQDAIAPCSGFQDTQVIPPIGSHISITGSFVQDTNHAKWNELHPVTQISFIK